VTRVQVSHHESSFSDSLRFSFGTFEWAPLKQAVPGGAVFNKSEPSLSQGLGVMYYSGTEVLHEGGLLAYLTWELGKYKSRPRMSTADSPCARRAVTGSGCLL
jgi:hypothetical protein